MVISTTPNHEYSLYHVYHCACPGTGDSRGERVIVIIHNYTTAHVGKYEISSLRVQEGKTSTIQATGFILR